MKENSNVLVLNFGTIVVYSSVSVEEFKRLLREIEDETKDQWMVNSKISEQEAKEISSVFPMLFYSNGRLVKKDESGKHELTILRRYASSF